MPISEGGITIDLPPGCTAARFDGDSHGLSHCMKAVDFVVETPRATILLELKDPDAGPPERRAEWIDRLSAGIIDNDLKTKFRDTWMYLYGLDLIRKPIYFLVLIGLANLSTETLAVRSERLRNQLPFHGPTGPWVNGFVEHCSVHNLETWNRTFEQFRAARV